MGILILFILYVISFIATVVTVLFINGYSTLLAIAFCALYLVTVNLLAKELNQ